MPLPTLKSEDGDEETAYIVKSYTPFVYKEGVNVNITSLFSFAPRVKLSGEISNQSV